MQRPHRPGPVRPNTTVQSSFITAKDVAVRFNIHVQTVYRWLREPRKPGTPPLRPYRFGGSVRFHIDDINRIERDAVDTGC